MKSLPFISILGVKITTANVGDIQGFVINNLAKQDPKLFVVTPNPEIITYAYYYPQFKDILNTADLALPDGIGIILAARFLGLHLDTRITGVDFMELICEKAAKNNASVGLLGGRHGVAKSTARRLVEKYPGLRVAYIAEEFNEAEFKKRPCDILFVAFGFPKQEQWIFQYKDRISFKVAMGVGGAFDYISGRVGRAPRWVRQIGFEWAYRLIREPWRIKRQVHLIYFVVLVIKEKFYPQKISIR